MLTRLKAAWLRWYVRHLARPGGQFDREAWADPNEKCPACGHRNGEMKFSGDVLWQDGEQGAIVHRCKDCEAYWFRRPLVNATVWFAQLPTPVKEEA